MRIKTIVGFLWGFYGDPKASKQTLSWQLLRDLQPFNSIPWLVIGDFNKVLFHEEKKCGCPRSERLMDNVRTPIESSNLFDLGYQGDFFTWASTLQPRVT